MRHALISVVNATWKSESFIPIVSKIIHSQRFHVSVMKGVTVRNVATIRKRIYIKPTMMNPPAVATDAVAVTTTRSRSTSRSRRRTTTTYSSRTLLASAMYFVVMVVTTTSLFIFSADTYAQETYTLEQLKGMTEEELEQICTCVCVCVCVSTTRDDQATTFCRMR